MNVDLRHALRHLANRGLTTPCQGPHKDRWISEDPDEREWAAHRCNGCPVLRECAAEAVAIRATWGIWGGQDRDPKSKSTNRKAS